MQDVGPALVDLPGALGGSRLFDRAEHRAAVAAWQGWLRAGRPVLLEVGFDHGRRLSATARHHPDWTVIGLEVRRQRVLEAQARAARDGLLNCHAWRVDARTVLASLTPPGSLRVVEALFPTPWGPGRRERTLIDAGFLDDVARALVPGGVLHVETDVPALAEAVGAMLNAHPALVLDPGAAHDRPAIEALSRRQWRCAQDGTPVAVFWARRVPDVEVPGQVAADDGEPTAAGRPIAGPQ